MAGGYLALDLAGHGGLSIAEKGDLLALGDIGFLYRMEQSAPRGKGRTASPEIAETADPQLLGALKNLRLRLAKERQVPAYLIFSDRTLADMAARCPRDLDAFAEAGADGLTMHPEAGPHVHRTLQHIRKLGKKAGVVLNPGTPIQAIDNLMDLVDLILIMSVNPGFGGQSFIESQLKKIEAARQRIDQTGRDIALQVDGGITAQTAPRAIAAGATVLVAGTAAFAGGPDRYAANIKALRG